MKALIWVACIILYAFVMAIINGFGVTLGGVPISIMFGGMILSAHALCNMCEEKSKIVMTVKTIITKQKRRKNNEDS